MKKSTEITSHTGLSRSDRYSPFLNPETLRIDSRTTDELLEATIRLTRLVNYYNESNLPDGDWEEFFNSDIDIMVMLLSKSRLKSIIRLFETIMSHMQDAEEATQAIPTWNKAFLFLYQMVMVLQKYRRKLMLPENRNHQTIALISIADSLDNEFGMFVRGYREFKNKFPDMADIELKSPHLSIADDDEETQPVQIFKDEAANRQTVQARAWFNSLFAALRIKFSNLISAADYYLSHLQEQGNVYAPHLALFVTFLHLYRYLQDEINHISHRHLDYYYNSVIQMHHAETAPDKMYLLFQLQPGKKQTVLRAGERILAEASDTNQTINYILRQDTIVSRAQIKELKTGFISRRQQFYSEESYKQVEELRMYTGEQPVLQPQQYKTDKDRYPHWALLGEEQNELPVSQRTMEDAILGLILSSPLLYAQDGKRTFRVRLHLSQASYGQFLDYVSNFSEVTGYRSQVLLSSLLSQSLILYITGKTGWEPITRYNIRLSSQPSERYVEVNFVLAVSDVATSVYNPQVHGENYNIQAPALQLVLNNNQFHHPYSFYKDFVLERISIHTSVTGSRQVQIRNSLGIVSTDNPFQFLGPLPVNGSYLDIKSTNIFNRYTKACSVHIEWFDLPKEAGGFETYFAGYETCIRNDSYTVSLSGLSDSRPVTASKLQQTFPLFQTTRNDTSQVFLKDNTQLDNIDCNRLLFQNDLLMNEEAGQSEEIVKGGSLRVELTAPDDGFGHRTYPQILPGIVAHNTRKLRHPFRIPNPPYIPVAKSIRVDYTLEHTEMLKSGTGDNDSFTLLHLYPFGYKEVYPNQEATDVHFIPPVTQESNLLIGLQDAEPGIVISFLFMLEETTYHHTAHTIEPVIWSFLHSDTWTLTKPDDMLYDGTNHFSTSGIVTIRLDDSIATGNHILHPDLYWLKASSAGGKTAGSRVAGIFSGAGIAVRDLSNDTAVHTVSLPPNAVKGFGRTVPDITAVWQLFPTQGGSEKEAENTYHLRVSERLRHKDRPLTALDFEQMILQAFPQLLTIRCIGREMKESLIIPGINLQVVVIPKKQDGRFAENQPKVSLATLLQIKEFINRKTVPFAKAEVGNAVYEEIKIVCSVGLKTNRLNSNDGYYLNQLNDDIKQFITPWLFGDNGVIQIGGKIYLSDVLNFIRNRPYISYISGFSVLHFYRQYNKLSGSWEASLVDSSQTNDSFMEASRPDAVLISADSHVLAIIQNTTYLPPVVSGIGDLVIGSELYLTRDKLSLTSETTTASSAADEDDDLYFHF